MKKGKLAAWDEYIRKESSERVYNLQQYEQHVCQEILRMVHARRVIGAAHGAGVVGAVFTVMSVATWYAFIQSRIRAA